jgi:hypothetical protein
MDELEITFISTFFGSSVEKFLEENRIKILQTIKGLFLVVNSQFISLEFSQLAEHSYFFFSDQYGSVFRIHIYSGGRYITGEIRKRISYKSYELICLLTTNQKQLPNFQQNVSYYQDIFEEIKE